MKKFTKLFLSCAAVAAVTAAVATSAMAADKTLTASYSVAEGASVGTVTITCASEDEAKTLLILKPGADKTAIKADDILQIDQAGTIATATVPVLDEEADKGTYIVLMGGTSGDIYAGQFKIGSAGVLIGDVDGNEDITMNDALAIARYKAAGTPLSDEGMLAADTNQDEDITMDDALCIAHYKAGNADKAGHVGETL